MSDINGVEDLIRRLDKLEKIDLTKAVGKAVLFVQGAAKSLVPVADGELRSSIFTDVEKRGDEVTGIVYTNKKYAPFVEFGTGPKGQRSHKGISPNIAVAYTQSPWWIHEGSGPNEVDRSTGLKYKWPYIDTPKGRFYRCSGQIAHPYMYPALKNHEDAVKKIVMNEVKKQL